MTGWENLCPGCMRNVNNPHIPCPYCGFDRKEYEKNRSFAVLPPYTVLAGKYLLGRVLGKGGFGITYLALAMNLDMVVAIKEFFPSELAARDTRLPGGGGRTVSVIKEEDRHYYESDLKSFGQEARNLAKLQKLPGVVSVLDLFFENGTAYLVMEYVEGITLKAYLQSHGNRLDEKTALGLMRPLMESLDEVHRNGIIHRDISPDNILINRDENNKITVTLIDFGAARVTAKNEGKNMTVLLKPGYAPLEQHERGKQGPWTDVYALCATLYRMISGKVPENAQIRRNQDRVRPLSLLAREENFQVSQQTSDVIHKGLSVQAEYRYANVRELIRALYIPRDPGPGPTPPPPQPPHPPMWLIGLLAGLAAVVVVLGVFVVIKSSGSGGQEDEDGYGYGDPTQEPTPEPTLEPVTAKLVDIGQVDFSSCKQVHVASADSSSVIQQDNGAVNTPIMIFDENIETNWQEGVDGSGIGEWIDAQFSQESQIKYLTFKLGNWKTNRYYYGNNKPKKMTITLGEFSDQIEFPDEWTEFCLEFSRPCEAESLFMTIDEVYRGTDWDDTCITDMRIFAEE